MSYLESSYYSKSSVDYYNGQTVEVVGEIKEDLRSIEGRNMLLKPIYINNNEVKYGLIQLSKNKINKNVKNGDLIITKLNMKRPDKSRNPGGFSYYNYLKKNRIYSLGYVLEIYKLERYFRYTSIIIAAKTYLINSIDNHIPRPVNEFVKAIVLGERKNLDPEWNSNFRKAGINHLLAISGLHIGFITLFLLFLLSKIKLSERLINLILFIFFIIYIMMTGFRPSVLRASFLVLIYRLAKVYDIEIQISDAVSIVLFLILLIDPYLLFSIGLQLSFLVLITIIVLKNIFDQYLVPILSVSLAAQLGSIPLTAYYFNSITPAGIVTNLWAVPLASLIVFLILTHFCISFILPALSPITGKIIYYLSAVLKRGTDLICTLPSAEIMVVKPTVITVLLYCIFIFTLAFYIKNKDIEDKKVKLFIKIFLIIIFFMIIFLYFFNPSLDQNKYLQIYCIDVGQGDSILIKTPAGYKILIDTGGYINKSTRTERTIIPFLLNKGIKRLDFLIITHFDSDHSAGLEKLIEKDFVRNIIVSKNFDSENSTFIESLKLIREKDIDIFYINSSDKLELKNTYIDFLAPINQQKFEDKNNNSIVFKLIYKQFDMIFSGDIEHSAEKSIIENHDFKTLRSDILKVAHHGSNTSSSEEFISQISPLESIISVGYNNHGHPDREIIERLKKNGSRIWRTDLNGAIIIKTDGKKYTISPHIID